MLLNYFKQLSNIMRCEHFEAHFSHCVENKQERDETGRETLLEGNGDN